MGTDQRERPSLHGQMLGDVLVALEQAGRAEAPCTPQMCATCAFLPDCMTNQMAATGLVAFNCAVGIDDSIFGCHHGMKNGEPKNVCAGWLAAREAPFEVVQAEVPRLLRRLQNLPDPDPVRAEFDAWIAIVDPANTMDDYERGRRWLKRDRRLERGGRE